MKPAPFDYIRIDSTEEACEVLAQYGEDARVLAGGQSLMATLNMRLAQPKLLVDVSRTASLDYVRVQDGALAIGAAVTQASIEWRAGLPNDVPLLALALPHIAHPQVRNLGTVCGSIAHADPSAELPLCLAVLEGEVVLRSRRGRRVLKAEQFVRGMLLTARHADELVEEVRYPVAVPGARYAFEEFSMRHGDFAIVAVAGVVTSNEIRLAVGAVADRPRVARWPRLEGSGLDTALNDFAWDLDAQDDLHASARYRRHLVRQLGRRVIEDAALGTASPGERP
jgi:2-furoyl-CoA dehydrogenase FAD binding subunit